MRMFFALVGFVAVLKILAGFAIFVRGLWDIPLNLPAEVSGLVSLALVLGSAAHYARRGTIIPPRPRLCILGAALAAPLLALALADPALRATWSPPALAFEIGLVLFQIVGLWTVGGVLIGGPFYLSSETSEDRRPG